MDRVDAIDTGTAREKKREKDLEREEVIATEELTSLLASLVMEEAMEVGEERERKRMKMREREEATESAEVRDFGAFLAREIETVMEKLRLRAPTRSLERAEASEMGDERNLADVLNSEEAMERLDAKFLRPTNWRARDEATEIAEEMKGMDFLLIKDAMDTAEEGTKWSETLLERDDVMERLENENFAAVFVRDKATDREDEANFATALTRDCVIDKEEEVNFVTSLVRVCVIDRELEVAFATFLTNISAPVIADESGTIHLTFVAPLFLYFPSNLALAFTEEETVLEFEVALTGGTISTQIVDARRKTTKTASTLRRLFQKESKSYGLPGPKKFDALSIFDVILPVLIDSIGSQKTLALAGRRNPSEDSRLLTWVKALISAKGTTLPSSPRASISCEMTTTTVTTWTTDAMASSDPVIGLPLSTEMLSRIETW